MTHPDLSDKPALYWGLRQAESIREALSLTLNGVVLRDMKMRGWLATQDVPDIPNLSEGVEGIRLKKTLDDGFEHGVGVHPDYLVRGSNAPIEEMIDCGAERSGAGWKDPANFVITSAFVRLLGAWEQFEMDVLKALFYYRPSCELLGHESERMLQTLEPEIIRETPEPDLNEPSKEIYKKPPLWTWMRKHAENNVERSKILIGQRHFSA